jgi:hypothetical protein
MGIGARAQPRIGRGGGPQTRTRISARPRPRIGAGISPRAQVRMATRVGPRTGARIGTRPGPRGQTRINRRTQTRISRRAQTRIGTGISAQARPRIAAGVGARIAAGVGARPHPRVAAGVSMRRPRITRARPRIDRSGGVLSGPRIRARIRWQQPGIGQRVGRGGGGRAAPGGGARIGPPVASRVKVRVVRGRAPPGPGGFRRTSVSHASPLRPAGHIPGNPAERNHYIMRHRPEAPLPGRLWSVIRAGSGPAGPGRSGPCSGPGGAGGHPARCRQDRSPATLHAPGRPLTSPVPDQGRRTPLTSAALGLACAVSCRRYTM